MSLNEFEGWLKEGKSQQKRSNFLKLEEGEQVEIIPKSAEVIQSPFDADKKIIEYTVEHEGMRKTFSSGSMIFGEEFYKALGMIENGKATHFIIGKSKEQVSTKNGMRSYKRWKIMKALKKDEVENVVNDEIDESEIPMN